MRDDVPALEQILAPVDEAVFFRDHWGRKALLIQDGDATRFDGLFSLEDVEEYLFSVRPGAGDVQLVRQGQWPPLSMIKGFFAPDLYDAQAAYNGLTAGYTIVLNAIHVRWPTARRLVAELEDRLLATLQTNVYVTGPNAQGFKIHHDDHDVFVLQTHGAKRWQIYDKPAADAPAGSSPVLLHDVELKRGDMLYMPKGFPHAAATSGDFSIHVTVGVFPLTWFELARQTLGSIAGQDSRWAEPVPLTELGAAAGPEVAEMRRRLDAGLSSLPDFTKVIEGYRHGLNATARRRNPAPDRYLTSLASVGDLSADTTIERRPGVGCVVSTDAEVASVFFMGETFRAPLKATAALRYIAAHPRFRITDIDDVLTDESKITLVRRLIREGLLQIAAR
jgi:ribosomal protein L16 Arg81 hydroxylase